MLERAVERMGPKLLASDRMEASERTDSESLAEELLLMSSLVWTGVDAGRASPESSSSNAALDLLGIQTFFSEQEGSDDGAFCDNIGKRYKRAFAPPRWPRKSLVIDYKNVGRSRDDKSEEDTQWFLIDFDEAVGISQLEPENHAPERGPSVDIWAIGYLLKTSIMTVPDELRVI
ncbi:hypothetical protein BDR26DRAFT_848388 [Obelidium mucronatum]|nr:hypothetical protein BDR26DRAFT_848388 [Obelidium mucronatum]